MIHICTVCGYQYNDYVEMTPFEQLPEDWPCPVCGASKTSFQSIRQEDLDSDP